MRPLKSIIARLVVFAGVAYSYVWAFWLQHEMIGSFIEVKDGATSVTASTSPQAVFMGLIGLSVYCILLKIPVTEQEFRVAIMWRRAAAFAIDFWFSVFSLGALFGFVDVLVEAVRTGTFRWHFHRDYIVATDWMSVVFVFVGLAAVVAYFPITVDETHSDSGMLDFQSRDSQLRGMRSLPAFQDCCAKIVCRVSRCMFAFEDV